MPHIFISYAKKDTRQLAENLYHALNAVPGLTAWMDMSLEAGSSWAQQIAREIDRCDFMIVLLSPDVNRPETATQAHSFVINEIDYAQGDRKPILPVMVMKTKSPVQLASAQYIDLTKTPTDPKPIVTEVQKRFGIVLDPLPELPVSQPLPTPSPSASSLNRRLGLGALLLGLIILVGISLTLLNNRGTLSSPTPTTAVSVIASNTLTPVTFSDPSTQVWLDFTRTAASYTATPTPTQTATATLTATPNATQTYEVAQQIAGLTLTAQSPGFTPITRNADWTPIPQDFDGVTMVLVPVGCFDMGNEDGQDDEKPVNRQCFDQPFWLDQTEVTQADFDRFGGQKANANRADGDLRPVEQITWFEARDFCALRGMRLPTEREWEYAARGPDNLLYPWGNDWNPANAIWSENANNQTANVGSRPAGASWVGALEMSGNVWEWVSSLYQAYPYVLDDGREDGDNTIGDRVLRGGSLTGASNSLRAPHRNWNSPDKRNWSYDYGFRCAHDYDAP